MERELKPLTFSLPAPKSKATNRYASLATEICKEFGLPTKGKEFESILFGAVLHSSGIGHQKAYEALQETKKRKKRIDYFWGCVNRIKAEGRCG